MSHKIAIIDYDEDLLESSKTTLLSRGYEVVTAADGVSGLQLLTRERPDIAVIELVLPKLPGLQVCDAVRRHPDLRHTKVLVAASATFPIDFRKARDLGAAYFLNKPYSAEDLARAVRSLESVPVPENEARRLATLQSYKILDSDPEKAFDDLSKLAAIICETPGAMISFVDSDRLWYKSKMGFLANEIPRELSFCAHAIMHEELMVVEDATTDERFSGNPLVNGEPKIRFYAGTPLRAASGDALGTVCVIDAKPRALSDAQKQALRLVANQVQVLLEWRKKMLTTNASAATAVQ